METASDSQHEVAALPSGDRTQPLKWHGGKRYLAERIIDMMPPHVRYLEPFAGGLSVLIQKDPFDPRHVVGKANEGCAEWVNDLNGELMNFWRVLRDEAFFAGFVRWMDATPLNEVDFATARTEIPIPPEKQIEAAVRFFVRMRMSRQGLGRDYTTPTRRTRRGMNEQVSAWQTAVEGLPEIHARLRRVEVWNRPAIEAIRKLDGPDLLVYADPPYLHETRATTGEYGPHEMTDDAHRELLQMLDRMQGKFILSGYANPMYDSFARASGWSRVDFNLPNNASSKSVKERKVECVWRNF